MSWPNFRSASRPDPESEKGESWVFPTPRKSPEKLQKKPRGLPGKSATKDLNLSVLATKQSASRSGAAPSRPMSAKSQFPSPLVSPQKKHVIPNAVREVRTAASLRIISGKNPSSLPPSCLHQKWFPQIPRLPYTPTMTEWDPTNYVRPSALQESMAAEVLALLYFTGTNASWTSAAATAASPPKLPRASRTVPSSASTPPTT